jgi:hypothetical protein
VPSPLKKTNKKKDQCLLPFLPHLCFKSSRNRPIPDPRYFYYYFLVSLFKLEGSSSRPIFFSTTRWQSVQLPLLLLLLPIHAAAAAAATIVACFTCHSLRKSMAFPRISRPSSTFTHYPICRRHLKHQLSSITSLSPPPPLFHASQSEQFRFGFNR